MAEHRKNESVRLEWRRGSIYIKRGWKERYISGRWMEAGREMEHERRGKTCAFDENLEDARHRMTA
jgi:hypothetical protein